MFAGKLFDGDIQYRLDNSGTYSGLSAGASSGWNSLLYNYFTDSFVSEALGVALSAEATYTVNTGVTQTICGLEIGSGVAITSATIASGTTAQVLEFDDVRIYADDSGIYEIKIGTVTWKINGTSYYTTSNVYKTGAMQVTPSSCPIIGYPPTLESSTGISPEPAVGCWNSSPLTNRSSTATSVGGYRVRHDGGDWMTYPVAYCGAPTDSDVTISGTDCWEVTTEAKYSETYTTGPNKRTIKDNYSQIMIVPDIPQGVVSMNEDYRALVYRWGLPRGRTALVTGNAITDCEFEPISDNYTTTYSTVYSSQNVMLAEMAEPDANNLIDGLILDALPETIYSPCRYINESREDTQFQIKYISNNKRCLWELVDEDTYVANYLTHPGGSWKALYFNTYPNYLWSCGLWFQDWNAFGGNVDENEYWLPAKQQYTFNAGLDTPSNKRVDVLSELLEYNGFKGLWKNDSLGLYSPWGISRFVVKTPDQTEFDFVENKTGLTTYTEGLPVTFGASNITVGVGTSSFFLEWKLDADNQRPYLLNKLAKQYNIDWTGTTPDISVQAFLIGYDGNKERISNNQKGWRNRPAAPANKKWASSYAYDFGQDYQEDIGIATFKLNRNISTSVISDFDLSVSPNLLDGFGSEKLRIEVSRTGICTVNYPKIRTENTADDWSLHLTGSHSIIVGENLPGYVPNALLHWDYLNDELIDPAVPHPQTNQNSIFDAIRSYNLMFLGTAPAYNFTNYVSDFDNPEEYTLPIHFARDTATLSASTGAFWTNEKDPELILVSSYREVPPLCFYSQYRRTKTNRWIPNDEEDVVNFAYSSISERKYHVSPKRNGINTDVFLTGKTLTYFNPAAGIGATGWSVGYHSGQVTGNESYTFGLGFGNTTYVKVRPWRGYYLYPGFAERIQRLKTIAAARSYDHSNLIIMKPDMKIIDTVKNPYDNKSLNVKEYAATHNLGIDPFVVFIEGNDLKIRNYENTMSKTILTKEDLQSPACVGLEDGTLHVYFVDDGEAKHVAFDTELNITDAISTCTGLPADIIQVAATAQIGEFGVIECRLVVATESAMSVFSSTNWKSFF